MSKEIDIKCEIDYVTLDRAIENLIVLREKHGGDAIVDTGVTSDPYCKDEYAYVCLIVKD